MIMQRDIPLPHLMALSAAAHRAFAATSEPWSELESSRPKGDPEREHMDAYQSELCRIWNDSLRAVCMAPVRNMEEVRTKAAFLLRPEFDVADLILGDDKTTVVQLLRSFANESQPSA